MIHVFHGFLGSPTDFSFLAQEGDVVFHDLYKEDPQTVEIGPEDTLIGYSMGGRVAMEIATRIKFNLKKLVIINSHPGLPEKERKERSVWEDSVLQRLKNSTVDNFLAYWNNLPLFAADAPLKGLDQERFKESAPLFERYRLSQQTCYLPELREHKDKVLWIAGIHDRKYADLARDLVMSENIPCVFINGGHRLYQKSDLLMETLKAKKVL